MRTFSCFPSPDERAAAAALLLLRTFSRPPSPMYLFCSSDEVSSSAIGSYGEDDEEFSFSSCSVESISSSVSSVRGGIERDPLKVLAFAARSLSIKREVSRPLSARFEFPHRKKQRTLLRYRCAPADSSFSQNECDDDNDATSSTITNARTTSTGTSSWCISSITSSSSRYWFRQVQARQVPSRKRTEKMRPQKASGNIFSLAEKTRAVCVVTNGVRRQAASIIRLLVEMGCASEVDIRKVLGNSPDTSKALRTLLRRQEVVRSGGGGRGDPFMYKASQQFNEVNLDP